MAFIGGLLACFSFFWFFGDGEPLTKLMYLFAICVGLGFMLIDRVLP